MLTHAELREIARARLKDGEALVSNGRFDGAYYVCGYAVEVALKARITKTLRWAGYPSTGGEFAGLQSFKTHNLEMLLKMTGWNAKIKAKYVAEWSDVADWDPEMRYLPVGFASRADAEAMLRNSQTIVKAL